MTSMKWEINEGKVVRGHRLTQWGASRQGLSLCPLPGPPPHPMTTEWLRDQGLCPPPSRAWDLGMLCRRAPSSL